LNGINTALESISNWSRRHGLIVNPAKSQAINVGSSKLLPKMDLDNLYPIYFNGVLIPYAQQVKNLGVIIDPTLSWVPQGGEVGRKMLASIIYFRRLWNVLPIPFKIALAQTLLTNPSYIRYR
jgi:hypothetical protein